MAKKKTGIPVIDNGSCDTPVEDLNKQIEEQQQRINQLSEELMRTKNENAVLKEIIVKLNAQIMGYMK